MSGTKVKRRPHRRIDDELLRVIIPPHPRPDTFLEEAADLNELSADFWFPPADRTVWRH